MSTLTDYILGIGGVQSLYPLDDAAGATINDLGPRNVDGTELSGSISRNGLGATGFVTGHSTCLQSSGSEARGWQIGAAADATLQLQVFTYFAFVMQTTAGGPNILGRQNGPQLGVTGGRKVAVSSTGGGGVTSPARANPSTIPLNTGHLVALTYDGAEWQPWLDGSPEGSYQRLVGSYTAFTNRVFILGDTGQLGATIKASVVGVADRILEPGEMATMYELGIGATTADDQAAFDYVADAVAGVPASGAGSRCRGCRGRRRAGEGGVKLTSPTREAHLACFGARALYRSAPVGAMPTSGMTARQHDAYVAKLADHILAVYSGSPSTAQQATGYWLSANGWLMAGATEVNNGNYGGFLCGLGKMHRYHGGGPYSSYIQRMDLVIQRFLRDRILEPEMKAGWFSQNNTFAGEWGGNGVFTFFQMLPGVHAVWDDLGADMKADWLDFCRGAADALWEWEHASYWANGNIVFHMWGIFRMMSALDPDGEAAHEYTARADAYWAFMFSPAGGGNSSAYVGGNLTGVGVRKYVDGTPANDPLLTPTTMRALNPATDKIYITEGLTSATGPGNTPSTTYGMDWNYSQADVQTAWEIADTCQDEDALNMMMMFANLTTPRHNLTNGTVTGPSGGSVNAWWSDYRGGTRHNVQELGAGIEMHTLRRLGRTTLLSESAQAGQFTFIEGDVVLNTTQQNVAYRGLAGYAGFLSASPYWRKTKAQKRLAT